MMYAKYTMTFYDTLEWIGGWDNVNARNQIFNNLYTANQDICTVLMEAFRYREIGFEIVPRFVHEFGENFTRLLPEYEIRKKMWDELASETEMLYNEGGKYERSVTETENNTGKETTTGEDTRNITSSQDTTNQGTNTSQTEQTDSTTNTGEENAVHSDTPGNNLNWAKNYASSADKTNTETEQSTTSSGSASNTVNSTQNMSGNSSDTLNKSENKDRSNNMNRVLEENRTEAYLRGKSKAEIYQMFTATTPEIWFTKQFDNVFMQVY